jgi:uncharacterized membrane protein YvbJ
MSAQPTPPVTRDQIESKLREIQGGIQNRIEERKKSLLAIGGTVAVVILVIAYLLGRRTGKKKTTLVEIRRV